MTWDVDIAGYRAVLLSNDSVKSIKALSLLVEPLSDKPDKEQFRDFVHHGGLDVIIDTLRQVNAESSLNLIVARCIVDMLLTYTHVQVNAFDDTIGTLPLLVYFLCERDHRAIDINWHWDDCRRLVDFLSSIIPLYGRSLRLDEQLSRDLALVIQVTLTTFPAGRCSPHVFEYISNSSDLLTHLKRQTDVARCLEDFHAVTSILLGVLSLGLSVEFTRIAIASHTLFTARTTFAKGLRCSCEFCETLRQSFKALRDRDEIGIPASFQQNKNMIRTLHKQGLRYMIGDFIKALTNHLEYNQRLPDTHVVDKHVEDTQQDVTPDENLLLMTDRILSEVASLVCLVTLQEVDERLSDVCSELACVIDKQGTIYRNIKSGFLPPGFTSLLCVICSWVMKTERASKKIQDLLWRLLLESSNQLLTFLENEGERDFPIQSFEWLNPFSQLLLASYLLRRELRDCRIDPEDICADSYKCNWDAYDLLSSALIAWTEKLLASSDSFNIQQMGSLSMSICVMCEGYDWFHVAENRRSVLHPPPVEAGKFLHTVRLLLKKGECLFINSLANLSVSRAEAAAALCGTYDCKNVL